MKLNFWIVGFTLILEGIVFGKNPSMLTFETQFPPILMQAKQLLGSGDRKAALMELDRAIIFVKRREDQRELDSRRKLFTEQFLTKEAFQKYQEAKTLVEDSHWDDALKELAAIDSKDSDNIFVLQLRVKILNGLKSFDKSEIVLKKILSYQPNDSDTALELVEVLTDKKDVGIASELLKKIEPKNSKQVERSIILKARILVASGQIDQAIDVLRKDHEAYLDHVEVIFELGMLYAQFDANLWPGRKTLSIFISRCKRMTPVELKALNLGEKLVRAQTQLDLIDKKLGV